MEAPSSFGKGPWSIRGTDEVEEEEVEEAPQLLLEQLSLEQRRAFERAMQGENLFLTGAAGTGPLGSFGGRLDLDCSLRKSFLLRYLIQELEKAYPGKAGVVKQARQVGQWIRCGVESTGLAEEPRNISK